MKNLQSRSRWLDYARQYAEKARELEEDLDVLKIQFANLEDFGRSLIAPSAKALRKLTFLKKVLSELASITTLTASEATLLEAVTALLIQGKEPTDRELADCFTSQLLGPLSRRAVQHEFGGADGNIDTTALAQSLQGGRLNDLLLFGRMRGYLRVFSRKTMRPKFSREFRGPFVPINEAEPILDLATELDNIQFFFRDGTPLKYDFVRLLAGEMLEVKFPEEVRISNPRTPVPKHVTVILHDVSGSMNDDNKHVISNALIQSYVDLAQTPVILKKAEHTVYAMAFDYDAHPAERIGSVKEAQTYFDNHRKHQMASGGGTDISRALIAVYDKIFAHQQEGGELSRANILVITDGQDNIKFDAIKAARSRISSKTRIVLNTITLGDTIDQFKDLIDDLGGEGDTDLGHISHQNISVREIRNLLDPTARLKQLLEAASSFDTEQEKALDVDDLLKLKQHLMRVSLDRDNAQTMLPGSALTIQRQLKSLPSVTSSPTIDSLFTFYLQGVVGAPSAKRERTTKIVDFVEFLRVAASQTRSSEEALLAALPAKTRQQILSDVFHDG